ncbi:MULTISPECIES: response regulator transcription factor [Methylobacterium]|uniref:response regulator transcription factor n=1 Tax=Methylobacterium TaxID=407 RepID=UPI0009EB5673|nr:MULTISPECIES: LuxR C-terminal-related transcriptional regulator [Methylobacterium]MCI9882456.1 response regulator transcription factor [Methylobacterium goesingense]
MYVLNGSRSTIQKAALQTHDNSDSETAIEINSVAVDGTIILIEPRHFIRECFVKGVESFSTFKVSAHATVEDWMSSGAGKSAVVLMLSGGGRSRQDVLSDFDILAKAGNLLPIMVLAEQDNIECILEMLGKGVRGYVPLNLPIRVAVEAIRLVKAGGTYVPAHSLVAARTPVKPPSLALHVGDAIFTHRQAAVLDALRSGKANKVIAYELSMQESTVKVHVRNIMRKLKAKNRTEVAVLINAFRHDARPHAPSEWNRDVHAM